MHADDGDDEAEDEDIGHKLIPLQFHAVQHQLIFMQAMFYVSKKAIFDATKCGRQALCGRSEGQEMKQEKCQLNCPRKAH